jgi:phosphoribosylformylglycinamidine synthase
VRFGIVVFPGSNCERDAYHVVSDLLGHPADLVWHRDTDLTRYDCVILPGGFAHGDHLRAGALARFSPIMRSVERFASDGGLVWGICNGFQVLVEAGLLPGAMLQNEGLRFVCRWTHTRVEPSTALLTRALRPGTVLRLPVAHHEGSYFIPEDQLAVLEANGQIMLRYCRPDGELARDANPNGSVSYIAGVCNARGNVFGLMPHPERCAEPILGGGDGRLLFESVIDALQPARPAGGGTSSTQPSAETVLDRR